MEGQQKASTSTGRLRSLITFTMQCGLPCCYASMLCCNTSMPMKGSRKWNAQVDRHRITVQDLLLWSV